MGASVYRNDKGNVILQTEWAIPALKKTIRSWDCVIIGNTGEIREKAIANIRKWATGWDGTTFAWFPANLPGLEAELVIENQPRNPPEFDEQGNPVTSSRVKWINPVGGGTTQKEMAADESAALDKLFSAKLRANAGARPMGGAAGVARPPAAQKRPSAPSAPRAGAIPPPAFLSTPETVSKLFYKLCEENGIEDRDGKWSDLVQSAGLQPDFDNWTPEMWGALYQKVESWGGLPF